MINEELAKALAHEIKAYLSGRRDKKQELYFKDKPKKNKQGVVTNGAINARLAVIVGQYTADNDSYADILKSKKDKEQTPLAFQQEKYQKLLSLMPGDVVDADLLDLKSECHRLMQGIEAEHDPVTWLTEYSPKAKDISFATHVGKLTHSSSKSSSVLDITLEQNDRYLATNRLADVVIDTASSNAASLPIAAILQVSVDGMSVLDCLKNGDASCFRQITDDKALVASWCEQLRQAYDSSEKKSYFLSKQTYFPVDDGQYHLLMPLKSSSLVHALHLEHKKYWDEDREFARKQRSAKKYASAETRTYPNKAYIHVTGSNHSNASSLNGQRGGRISLLSARPPPQWRSSGTSYSKRSSVFDRALSYTLRDDIEELKKYLLLLKSKELSVSEPVRHAAVVNKLDVISEHFFDHIQAISMREDEGWTFGSELPIEEQLLIEPWRDDELAKSTKVNNHWQDKLSKRYGKWLSRQLSNKTKLSLKPVHEALWAKYFAENLREFIAAQEVLL